MALRILHLLDSTVPGDAFDVLALLLPEQAEHRLAALGHHSTKNLAALANISPAAITFLPSAGWADPTGWRAVRKLIAEFRPTHVHAWGAPAAIALAASRFSGPRIATFTDLPRPRHLQVLRLIDRRAKKNPFTWTTTLACIRERLGLQSPVRLTPACVPPVAAADPARVAAVRQSLGIAKTDGPILLLGGEGRRARYDLGLWVAGIAQHLFPNLRTIVREDPRGDDVGLEKFLYTLADENMPAIAPPELPWKTLVQAADVMLVTAESPLPAGSILAAVAAGLPIASGPCPTVADLLEHNVSAAIAPSFKPRELSQQLESLLSNLPVAQGFAAAAREKHPANAGAVVDAYRSLYAGVAVEAAS